MTTVLALPTEITDELHLLRAPAVLAATGATYRQLDYWDRCGYLEPARPGKGSGTQRLWHPDEVAVIRRMVHLVHIGLHPKTAALAARNGYTTWLSDTVKVTVLDAPSDHQRSRARRRLPADVARRARLRQRRPLPRRRPYPRRLRRSTED